MVSSVVNSVVIQQPVVHKPNPSLETTVPAKPLAAAMDAPPGVTRALDPWETFSGTAKPEMTLGQPQIAPPAQSRVTVGLQPTPATASAPLAALAPSDLALAAPPLALAAAPKGASAGVAAPRAVGTKTDALSAKQLQPVAGVLTGAPLLIVDNPETFRKPGVLGSTIAPVPLRGDGTYQFEGSAQTFALAQNGTGAPQRFSHVFHNRSAQDATVSVKGTIYMPSVTKTDGRIPHGYQKDGGFRGPQAIASSTHANAVPGKNGYLSQTTKVPAGQTVALTDTYHPPGAEVFARLSIVAKTSAGQPAPFALAVMSSPQSLRANDFARLRSGESPPAGLPQDFAPARREKGELGRPNGVIVPGGTFSGGRTIDVGTVARTGDLFMATRFKNAGNTNEIARLSRVLGNLNGTPAATTDDGNFGVNYDLRYALDNSSNKPRQVEIRLTAPATDGKAHHPLGGEMTTALRVNGRVVEARVDKRGEGTVIGNIVVLPGRPARVSIEMTNFGNNFPPGAIEFVAR